MLKNKISLSLTFFVLLTTISFAQLKKKPLKKTETPNKDSDVQVFDEGNSSDIFDVKSSVEVNNTLKINVLSAFAGDVALNYERVLSPHFSVEAGLGITLPTLRAGNYLQNSGFLGFNYGEEVVLDKGNTSPYASLAVRYFPSKGESDIPAGLYFSLGTQFRKYNFSSHLINESVPFVPQKSITQHFDYVRFTVGKTTMIDRLVLEYYVGLALRNTVKSSYSYDLNNNYEITPYSVKSSAPTIVIGYKVGFGF